jgi:predicted acylesterase/phospholipase RssA
MRPIASPAPAEVREFLASTRLFSMLDAPSRERLATQLEWWLAPGGTIVLRQGERGDALYLVYHGRLVVEREVPDRPPEVAGQKGRGDSLGEMAVLTGHPRSATVRALRDTVLASLSRERAGAVLRAHPEVLLALAHQLAGWLEEEPQPMAGAGCVAVAVTAAGPQVSLPDFAAGLAQSLGRGGRVLHLDARRVDAALGEGAAACADGSPTLGAMTAWLSEQEARHEVVLYEADAAITPWTSRCLRQADRILVVAAGGAQPSLGALGAELELLERDQGRQLEQLVLLHEPHDGLRPRNTGGWLALRDFRRHHHLRRGDPAGLDRLARFLTNRAVGLVLGGGGARSFAHVGVLRALEEAGIPVDRIGGTSMGAVIGALYARGESWRQVLEIQREGWLRIAPQNRYTLPLISVLSSVRGERMLAMMFGDGTIEDLERSFFCVSTNISTTTLKVHRTGPLVTAVGASMTIPGVTAPIVDRDGELLVDGGVLNNLPTDVMQQLGAGPVIASDVSAARDLRAHPSYLKTPSPWQLLRNRLWPRPELRPFPTLLRLVHRAAVMASDVYAKNAKREVELFLDLPMEQFDMFDMRALDAAAEFGYRHACEELAKPGVLERFPR